MRKTSWLVVLLLLAFAAPLMRADAVYTSSATFNTAIAGSTITTQNFDSTAAGTLVTTLGGLTFSYNCGGCGASLVVQDLFDTTSGTNYLGTDDVTGALFGGDSLTLTFSSPVNAAGLFIIGFNSVLAGDFTLSNGATSVSNPLLQESTLGDGGLVYFLGISSASGFSSITLTSVPGGPLFNVDDITTATGTITPPITTVPEPASFLLLGSGALGMLWRKRRSKR